MTDGNIIANHTGKARIEMYNRAILNVRTLANFDVFQVASQDTIKPDTRFFTNSNGTDNHCTGGNESGWVDLG
jgi:hypothetical protein